MQLRHSTACANEQANAIATFSQFAGVLESAHH